MSIHAKLLNVRKSVPYLKKDAKGAMFQYVSSSQTLGALRKAMDDEGLLLIPSVKKAECRDVTTAKGRTQHFTELTFTFTWFSVETGESLVCEWYGQGVDDGEKGVGKACTYAEKYFLLKFFNIATDKDDPDSFQQKNSPEEKPKAKPAPELCSSEQRNLIEKILLDPHLSEEQVDRARPILHDAKLTAKKATAVLERLQELIIKQGGGK